MMYFTTTVAALSAISAVLAQSGLIIQSPAALVQCQPVLISWSGGSAPYYISVIPGGQASAAALESFPTQTGNSLTWNVDLSSGQEVTFKVVDSSGAINYSSPVPIQAGSSTSCSGGVSAGGAGSSSSASAPASSSSSSARSSSSSAASPSSSGMSTSTRMPLSSTGSSTSSSSSAPSTTSAVQPAAASTTGAASFNAVANMVGLVGVAGLVALLA